jgi:nitrile hydratase beta subunit
MNGVHDMGGMQDMGPVRREKDEPVFHAPWERRMFALLNAMDLEWPVIRSQIDLIPPADYLRVSYYEKWLAALGPLLTKAGMVTQAEIESGNAIGALSKKWHVLSVADVATWISPGSNASAKPTATARFQVGQRVRAKNMNPEGHTRLPRYARGKTGSIARDGGVDVFPDAVAQSLDKKPQHVYSVRFEARELWGSQANMRDSVYADLWEDYLEPA